MKWQQWLEFFSSQLSCTGIEADACGCLGPSRPRLLPVAPSPSADSIDVVCRHVRGPKGLVGVTGQVFSDGYELAMLHIREYLVHATRAQSSSPSLRGLSAMSRTAPHKTTTVA